MSRKVGPERAHFGGEDGLIIKIKGGKPAYSWACNFCNFEIGGQCFPNRKARIHLTGNNEMRDGSISTVCSEAPEKIKKQFTKIVLAKRAAKEQAGASRKRAAELMAASPEFVATAGPQKKNRWKTQTTLPFTSAGKLKCNEVDDAWTKCFVALDIAPNKVDSPFFKAALEATKRAPAK